MFVARVFPSALPLLCAVLLSGQTQLNPRMTAEASNVMDHAVASGELQCHTRNLKPFLDFALRFEAAFVTDCALAQFQGQVTRLGIYLRVTPLGGSPSIFADVINLPVAVPDRRTRMHWSRFHEQIEFSGAVGVGEGRYRVELLLVDQRNRVHRKNWNLKVEARGKEKSVKPTLHPYQISALVLPPWRAQPRTSTPNPRSVTVLLNVAPLFPSTLKLRAWDRYFLVGALASLLHELEATEVRVVAFNLDQQREIYRADAFEPNSFPALMRSMQALELGTVSYRTLQRRNGWADLLVKFVNDELLRQRPSDAVIFLGPNCRILDKIDPDYIRARADIGPRMYYFEYFTRIGYEFPDAIHHLTNACKGTVFKLHSPADFAASIAKLQRRLDGEARLPSSQ